MGIAIRYESRIGLGSGIAALSGRRVGQVCSMTGRLVVSRHVFRGTRCFFHLENAIFDFEGNCSRK